jgi:hypothetical protein
VRQLELKWFHVHLQSFINSLCCLIEMLLLIMNGIRGEYPIFEILISVLPVVHKGCRVHAFYKLATILVFRFFLMDSLV